MEYLKILIFFIWILLISFTLFIYVSSLYYKLEYEHSNLFFNLKKQLYTKLGFIIINVDNVVSEIYITNTNIMLFENSFIFNEEFLNFLSDNKIKYIPLTSRPALAFSSQHKLNGYKTYIVLQNKKHAVLLKLMFGSILDV